MNYLIVDVVVENWSEEAVIIGTISFLAQNVIFLNTLRYSLIHQQFKPVIYNLVMSFQNIRIREKLNKALIRTEVAIIMLSSLMCLQFVVV